MPFSFQPKRIYWMPTHFGPATGPRQRPDGRTFTCMDNPKTTTVAVSFLTNHEPLAALLPERFTVAGEPVVTVQASYMTEYVCLSPAGHSHCVVTERWVGDGTVDFHPARWEEMPTQYTIVNTFHALEIKEYRGASITKSVGGEDLSAQRILR